MELSELFDEFVEEYNCGNEPQVENYLRRCPSNEKELQNLINVFFIARYNLPSDIQRKSWQSFSESFFSNEMTFLKQLESMTLGDALIYLSRKFGMHREVVVKALMNRFGLDTKNQAKVERFHWQYHRLENNFINPKQVSRRLLKAAADVFQTPMGYLEDAQQRSHYMETAQPMEMKIAARVAEEKGMYREHSRRPETDDQKDSRICDSPPLGRGQGWVAKTCFEEIDQLFTGVKDNAE